MKTLHHSFIVVTYCEDQSKASFKLKIDQTLKVSEILNAIIQSFKVNDENFRFIKLKLNLTFIIEEQT